MYVRHKADQSVATMCKTYVRQSVATYVHRCYHVYGKVRV